MAHDKTATWQEWEKTLTTYGEKSKQAASSLFSVNEKIDAVIAELQALAHRLEKLRKVQSDLDAALVILKGVEDDIGNDESAAISFNIQVRIAHDLLELVRTDMGRWVAHAADDADSNSIKAT